MKTTTRIITLGAILCATILAFATTGFAGQERINPKEPIVQVNPQERFDWSGFYIGGNLGGVWNQYEFKGTNESSAIETAFDTQQADDILDPIELGPEDFPTITFSPSISGGVSTGNNNFNLGSDSSVAGGGQVGFQWQWGHIVVGVEGDWDRTATNQWATFNDHYFIPVDGTNGHGERLQGDATISRKAETDWVASARARLGWANGPVLLYVTGGGAFAHVRAWASDQATMDMFVLGERDPIAAGTFTNVSRDDDVQTGWTVGGGGEYAFNETFSIGLEYRHSNFGTETYHFNDHGGPLFPGPLRVDLNSDQVVFKVNVNLCSLFGFRH
jgi:outer membrane immunogenic protein